MNWTTQRPTVEGWYWMRNYFETKVVRVVRLTHDSERLRVVTGCGASMMENLAPETQWSGPIEEPK